MVGGGDHFYLKFCFNRPRWSEIADFEPIFARSVSAVTPSEKSLINTNREVYYALSNDRKMIIVDIEALFAVVMYFLHHCYRSFFI